MRKTLTHLVVLLLSVAGLSVAQENYGNWKYYRFVTVNTTSSGGGANVSATEANFPLLVRLNSSNFTFSHAKGNGGDLRFTDVAGTTRYKHQVESWDSAGQAASVWVLVPSVAGNSSTTLRIYSSRALAADSSSGKAVFDTLNNFQGVFHLGEATGDTARDATAHLFKGIPRNRGGSNPTDTVGAIGHAKNFLGSGSTNNGGSYQILTSNGGTTYTNNALNFQNDSSTVNGQPLYTISAWIYVSEFPTGTSNLKAIIAKSSGLTSATQYCLKLIDPAINQVTTPVGDTMRIQFIDPVPAVYKSGVNPIATGNWYHVAAVRNGARGDSTHLRVWVNGYAPPAGTGITSTNIAPTTRQDLNTYIGSFSNDSGYFNGKIDEVEFSNIARDSGWLMLSYQTQRPNATAVSLGAEQTNPDAITISYPVTTLNLVAGSAMAVDSPTVLTGTATSFSVSPALPSGLTLSTTTGVVRGTPAANVAVATATYTVTANGVGGSSTTAALSITVLAPPSITSQPILATALLNPGAGVAKFGIKATGSATLLYRWVRTRGVTVDTPSNGGTAPAAIFSGVSTDTLTITNAPYSDSNTTYKCVVVNSVGNAVSNAGALVVNRIVGIWKPQVIRVTGMSPFSFRVPQAVSSIRMTVENMGGRVVWSKDVKANATGIVSWNGGGADGRPVASGMYVVKMKLLDAQSKALGEATQTGINSR